MSIKSILLSLLVVGLYSTALATPVGDNAVVKRGTPNTINVGSVKCATNTQNRFHTKKVSAAALSIGLITPDHHLPMPARSTRRWPFGEGNICAFNQYVFENTHVDESVIAQAALKILANCCGNKVYTDADTCAGGNILTYGDSGLNIPVYVHRDC
ncbi:hypothetical protein BKA64DRAFT_767323 [Cadophora sp. MPI-SDFR-AT-0126]|nr:hypothetical protein BKA64DRAFT_767323 [Leotiomycetes sp. MPI-SDFR-AT-0126]